MLFSLFLSFFFSTQVLGVFQVLIPVPINLTAANQEAKEVHIRHTSILIPVNLTANLEQKDLAANLEEDEVPIPIALVIYILD